MVSVHDSRAAKGLAKKCGGNDEDIYLDSAYIGTEEDLRATGMTPIVCEKGYRGLPLTETQKESNRKKSKVHCRVEHVFGFMEQSMRGLVFRGVGMVRAKANIAMTNLVYYICRLAQINKYHLKWILSK